MKKIPNKNAFDPNLLSRKIINPTGTNVIRWLEVLLGDISEVLKDTSTMPSTVKINLNRLASAVKSLKDGLIKIIGFKDIKGMPEGPAKVIQAKITSPQIVMIIYYLTTCRRFIKDYNTVYPLFLNWHSLPISINTEKKNNKFI